MWMPTRRQACFSVCGTAQMHGTADSVRADTTGRAPWLQGCGSRHGGKGGSHCFADAKVMRSLGELLAKVRLLAPVKPLSTLGRPRGSSSKGRHEHAGCVARGGRSACAAVPLAPGRTRKHAHSNICCGKRYAVPVSLLPGVPAGRRVGAARHAQSNELRIVCENTSHDCSTHLFVR